jgi:hypothetical protein
VKEGTSIMRVLKKIGSTESLLLCGVIGPLLFIIVLLIEGATRPGYSAWQTDGSYLSLTNQGWEQIANFLICGALCIAFAVGLRRVWRTGRGSVWGPLLIGLFGLGLVFAGVFVTDPGGGYPPGAPINAMPFTWHGWVHGINGLLLFNVTLPAACFVVSRRFAADQHPRWATYSWLTGAFILVVSLPVGIIIIPFAERAGFPVLDGFFQRIEISVGWIWIALVALHVWREQCKTRMEEASSSLSVTNANVS